MMRSCFRCKQLKPLNDFAKNKKKPFGRAYVCKECEAARVREYKRSHPDKVKKQKVKWIETNRNYHLEYHSAYSKSKRPSSKTKAREAVSQAVKQGKLLPVNHYSCSFSGCNEPGDEYHHYLGYEPEHWLDVKPLCHKHHGVTHRKYV